MALAGGDVQYEGPLQRNFKDATAYDIVAYGGGLVIGAEMVQLRSGGSDQRRQRQHTGDLGNRKGVQDPEPGSANDIATDSCGSVVKIVTLFADGSDVVHAAKDSL